MASDDWELVDGTPRWVWRLDELLAREFPKRTTPDEAMAVVKLARERARAMGVTDAWLGDKLQHCRSRRNSVAVN